VYDGIRLRRALYGRMVCARMRRSTLQTVVLPAAVGAGPYRVRGIGEVPCTPVAAAIANAVQAACGVRLRTLPVTAEKVYQALQAPR